MGNSSHAPCDPKDVAAKLHALVGTNGTNAPQNDSKIVHEPPAGKLTLAEYGIAKQVSAQLLTHWFGAREGKHPYYGGIESGVCFPYFNANGDEVTQQWRWGMGKGKRRFLRNKPTYLYGGRFLKLLEEMAVNGDERHEIFIVEGESNTHTLAQNGFPVIGLPGVQGWQKEWAQLKCLQAAKRLYVFLDMKDGEPEDVAIIGARKIAESFPAGKVLAVKMPFPYKDVSETWLRHMTDVFGAGPDGFRRDLQDAILSATPIIPIREDLTGLPPDLGEQVFKGCEILRDFVNLTAPQVETDVNNLVCDFLACAGAAIGLKAHAKIVADRHPAATYHLLIADSATGKGTCFNTVNSLFSIAVADWNKYPRHSVRSTQALIRMLAEVSSETITEGEDDKAEAKPNPNPKYTEGRLLLRTPEISSIFKSMRAEWNTVSQTLREAYDGGPLSNERGDQALSVYVNNPYALALLGDITGWELSEVIQGVDFANGSANRFIWCVSHRSKLIPRGGKLPDYSALAERLKRVIPTTPLGELTFSESGGAAWDGWVYTLPLEDAGRLGSACGRMRANALRLAVLFAVLDENRLSLPGAPRIEAAHVHAAAAIMNRHRDTVAWFLNRPAAMPEVSEVQKGKLWPRVEKLRGALKNGRITAYEYKKLFSNITAEERTEIAKAAGLEMSKERDEKGNEITVWS
jgi:hypothetical protein